MLQRDNPRLPKARSSQKSIRVSPGALSLLPRLCTARFAPNTKDRERGVLQRGERRRGQHRAPSPAWSCPRSRSAARWKEERAKPGKLLPHHIY